MIDAPAMIPELETPMTPRQQPISKVKYMVIVRGKGTDYETRIQTTIPMYFSEGLGRYVTIPGSRP